MQSIDSEPHCRRQTRRSTTDLSLPTGVALKHGIAPVNTPASGMPCPALLLMFKQVGWCGGYVSTWWGCNQPNKSTSLIIKLITSLITNPMTYLLTNQLTEHAMGGSRDSPGCWSDAGLMVISGDSPRVLANAVFWLSVYHYSRYLSRNYFNSPNF